jgi:cell division protein FtsB
LHSTNGHLPTPDLPEPLVRLIARLSSIIERVYGFRRKLATAAVLAIAAMVAYHAVFGENGMVVFERKRAELRTVNADVDKLQQENQRLTDQVKALKSDPKAIEKEAREQLRYARPGEVIYLLPGQPKPDTPPANATAEKR